MPKNSSGLPQPTVVIEPTSRSDVAASFAFIGVAVVVLGMLAFFTAPVSSSNDQNFAPARAAGPSAGASYSLDADGKRVPLFFGYLEFDWDPNAPGTVPGFESWPKHEPRVTAASAGE